MFTKAKPALNKILCPPIENSYLQQISSLSNGINLELKSNVTFFVGENGSGKSTLLEGIAEQCGFNLRGGNRNHNLNTGHRFEGYESALAEYLKLIWSPRRVTEGFFMRAESFFNFASYIDEIAKEDSRILNAYGGRSLHQQSHGESFLALFNNQFESGVYILDEPEAALSPARVLAFMSVISELEKGGRAQFLIATHSPILLCYPSATVLQFDDSGITEVSYTDTEHFTLTKSFLNNPELYLRHLM
ncbi:AAA family ATPase [Mucilaginibacter achroorhodeus]|uniref:AAA family ATPase n=1 Tax=Mucilaginibacter achroorhodeus TaxID=2599294 RepID=A0A563U7F9_9SPHI|nr:AAA family ATPase [Mucilaginibacter achroorhodeus]